MDIKRNDIASLPRFAALNAAWIEDLHYLEESDKLMVAHPEIYTQNGNHVFTVQRLLALARLRNMTMAVMSSPKWRSIQNFKAAASANIL